MFRDKRCGRTLFELYIPDMVERGKQDNAEELPNTDRVIKRRKTAAKFAAVFYLPSENSY